MSIIEKALRQAQEPLLKPQPPAVHAPRSTEPPSAAPGLIHSWPMEASAESQPAASAPSTKTLVLVATLVLASTAALVIGGAVWLKRTLATRNTSAVASTILIPTTLPAPAAAPAPVVPIASAPPAHRPGDAQRRGPVLTGVIGGSGTPYAMIDGEIVGVGETVGTWTLEAIRGSAVTLRRADGATTTLQLQQ